MVCPVPFFFHQNTGNQFFNHTAKRPRVKTPELTTESYLSRYTRKTIDNLIQAATSLWVGDSRIVTQGA
jgi:hypothetical protein